MLLVILIAKCSINAKCYRWNSIGLKEQLCHFTAGVNWVAYTFCYQYRMINLLCL
uniref:Uncharacterized protein n=1 Tax=Rhizophora mucronata TaxID=61149 RepID=A0A2P2K6Q9_RHIMU